MVGTNVKTDTNVKLPLSFILYGLFAFVAAQFILFFNSKDLLTGLFRIPKIWMSAHFFMLGFAVMTAMGAMYQLVPVVFLTPIWNQAFGFLQFFLTAIGITVFAFLLGYKTNIAVYGGLLTVIGILMFLFQMGKTISLQKTKTPVKKFIVTALFFFFCTIAAGFWLAWNLAFGGHANHMDILYSHMTFGLAGWFTLLIFGFSYKLVPMFSLSHGFSEQWAKPAFITYLSGMIVTIISYWVHLNNLVTLGFFLLFLGFLLFVLDMREIVIKRMKKKLDAPFCFSLMAIINGLIVHFFILMIVLFNLHSEQLWAWTIYLYMTTWIFFSILGYLYKIIPFLWWTHKYSERVGKEEVPQLKEMLNEKLGFVLYRMLAINVLGIIVSVSFQLAIGFFIFTGLMALTTLVYAVSIVFILTK